MKVRIELHERVTAWREHAGISKAELARRCEVSSAGGAQWEMPKSEGGTEPTHDSVDKIAEACGATLSEFWADTLPTKKAKAAS